MQELAYITTFTIGQRLTKSYYNAKQSTVVVNVDERFQCFDRCQGIILQSSVLACERVAAQYRALAGAMIGVFWGVATCFLALLAYLVQNWVHLQLTISLLSLMTIPLYWYVVPQTHTQRDINRPMTLLQKACTTA